MGFFLLLSVIISVLISIRLFLYRTTLIYRLKKWGHWIEDRIHVHQTLKVPELNDNHQENLFYRKVSTYLNSLPTIEDSDFTNLVSSSNKPNAVVCSLDHDQTIMDSFLGARVSWTNRVRSVQDGPTKHVIKMFELKVKKKDKRRILQAYIQHIYRVTEDIETRFKELKLFMNNVVLQPAIGYNVSRWSSVRLTHPATIDTIAMDPDLKKKVKSDLDSFLKSELFYHRLGRVWKRSYLLYGPSGTGKSSFIAAMAKYLSYDIYDIDLAKVKDDTHLKTLLLQTSRKSLIVVEDLDRFITPTSSSSILTCSASGSVGLSLTCVLNFMDGLLVSCVGDEKIMVFTMNSKEHVDPALLRPGRVDVHIYFPMCDFNSFKMLANSYLGLKDHKLFPQVEEMLMTGATMSPAEMSELMISNRGSPGRALKSVISALQVPKGGVRVRHDEEVTSAEEEGVLVMDSSCSVPVVKEIQKLYGLLRMKSKKIGPSDDHSGLIERSR